ncbi:hypothetical protein EDD11_009910 [Mortierella claussenii]|nr:hypothetical protein EDD11_009910 [Mortierella claussenii]
MAGMGSPEYRQFYTDGSALSNQDQELGRAAATITISDPCSKKDMTCISASTEAAAGTESGASSTTSATASDLYPNIGLDHWNKTREQWTKGRWHIVPSANSNNPALSAIHPGNHDAIYDSLVYDRKRLSKPIPLPLVIKVLVSGWKRDGLWQESPAQPQSGPGSTPSSTPSATPGFNAYVPGFSSTHSQPLVRKA